ncbi:MFS transporter [Halobacillus locisalis]|uniref:MFS transporter n=1 Tax=Halobacillus locisalis TaxID=220753 RepID=A0A838CPG2_9BACI|nr:MFS transporter [Halobacillus locisalis]MBA2173729.1 MFS transporter [Halobacillus locisalis]
MEVEQRQDIKTDWKKNKLAFRLLGSNFVSFFGDQIYMVALPLIVLGLTGSPLQMGIVAALERTPVMLQPFAGVMADRMSRRRLLLICDGGRFLLMGSMGVLALSSLLEMYMIYIGALSVGVLTQLYQTAQFATLPRLVHKEHLDLFNSINTGMLQLSLMLAPGLGGMIISLWAPGIALMINSVSFLVGFLFMLSIPQSGRKNKVGGNVWREVLEGARFVFNEKPIFFTNVAMFFSIFGTTLFLTMMIVHVKLLSFTALEIGWFLSIGGVGAILGATSLNVIKPLVTARTLLFSAGVVGAISIMMFSFFESFWMLALMNAIGTAMAALKSPAIVTIRQRLTPDYLLGRVQATSRWMTWILMPVAALVSGILAESIGTGTTILIGGSIACLASFIYLHPSLSKV